MFSRTRHTAPKYSIDLEHVRSTRSSERNTPLEKGRGLILYSENQRTDSPESRLEGNGLEVFTLFCSNLLKAFKIQNNLTIGQYYMQACF